MEKPSGHLHDITAVRARHYVPRHYIRPRPPVAAVPHRYAAQLLNLSVDILKLVFYAAGIVVAASAAFEFFTDQFHH